MTDIPIQTYQDEQILEPLEPENATSARIGEIYEDGVTLIFDGTETPTNKRYKVNKSIIFAPGDRVKIFKDSKTYIVEYPFGAPKQKQEDAVELANRALLADNALKLGGKSADELSVDNAKTAGSAKTAESATTSQSATQANQAYYLMSSNSAFQLRISGRYIQIRSTGGYNTPWLNLVDISS